MRVRINYVKALVVVLFLRKQPILVSLVVTINININIIIAIVVGTCTVHIPDRYEVPFIIRWNMTDSLSIEDMIGQGDTRYNI